MKNDKKAYKQQKVPKKARHTMQVTHAGAARISSFLFVTFFVNPALDPQLHQKLQPAESIVKHRVALASAAGGGAPLSYGEKDTARGPLAGLIERANAL